MKQTMRHADGTNHRARHVAAAKTAAEGRHAIAAARRTHMGEVRAAVRTQIVESYRRRQEISQALVELRRGVTEFRTQLRTRLPPTGKHGRRSTTTRSAPAVPAPPAASNGNRDGDSDVPAD
jgi:hypothetical protein